ncbi:hypothetical protein X777_11336 [Ooceraea biroi]|uniref:Uncharacterized protein n=1 Tax=Ooceraea biroi TaxID=2015173 RepID=A0A026W294_OOCBI|nr:hypothetical protein X777_11336 [Ooceraea biroi]
MARTTGRRKRATTAAKRPARTLPIAKRGGFLPLLPVLGALGSLIGGAAGVAKAVNDSKAKRRQLEELQRHNRAMEGRGLYLAPHARGRGTKKKKKKTSPSALGLPPGATTGAQLAAAAARLCVPFFRGVFMRDALPARARHNECGIVNLDASAGPGTHWVAYAKRGERVVYFDDFGNLRPPRALERYLGGATSIAYNRNRYQTYDEQNCGQLCLRGRRFIMSLTLTLTGRSSVLTVCYFPPIDLSDGSYELGLADFETYNSIPNVDATNNRFYFGERDALITIPEGSYELRAISRFLRNAVLRRRDAVGDDDDDDDDDDDSVGTYDMYDGEESTGKDVLALRANDNTMRSEMKCAYRVNFAKPGTIGPLLGFSPRTRERPEEEGKVRGSGNGTTLNTENAAFLRSLGYTVLRNGYDGRRTRHWR